MTPGSGSCASTSAVPTHNSPHPRESPRPRIYNLAIRTVPFISLIQPYLLRSIVCMPYETEALRLLPPRCHHRPWMYPKAQIQNPNARGIHFYTGAVKVAHDSRLYIRSMLAGNVMWPYKWVTISHALHSWYIIRMSTSRLTQPASSRCCASIQA